MSDRTMNATVNSLNSDIARWEKRRDAWKAKHDESAREGERIEGVLKTLRQSVQAIQGTATKGSS